MQIPSLSAKSLQSASAFLSNPTWDVLLVMVLVGGTLFWAFLAGRRKIVSTIMVTYVALAIFPAIPVSRFTALLGLRDPLAGTIGIFLVLFLVMVWLLGARRARPFARGAAWWQVFFLSMAQTGLLAHTILSLLPPAQIALLSPLTRRVFVGPTVHLWWLIVPVLLLAVIRRLAMRDE